MQYQGGAASVEVRVSRKCSWASEAPADSLPRVGLLHQRIYDLPLHQQCFPIPLFSVAQRSKGEIAPFGNFCGNWQAGIRRFSCIRANSLL
jgi:hypothetical protein